MSANPLGLHAGMRMLVSDKFEAHQQHDNPDDSTFSFSDVPPLQERQRLKLICRSTRKENWKLMRCCVGLQDGTECCILRKTTKSKPVLCEDKVISLDVPQLKCSNHAKTFTVTGEPKSWAHVEQLQEAGEVFVHPHIVVLSQKVLLTMKAYRCVFFAHL